MSEFHFKCPHCETSIGINESLIGQEIPCPDCGNIITPMRPPKKKVQLAVPRRKAAYSDYEDEDEPPRRSRRPKRRAEDSASDHYSLQPEGIYANKSTANAVNAYCPWALFVFILGCLQVVCSVILLVLAIANESTEAIIGAISLIFSSSFLFMSAWIVQQIHVANELKRLQIKMLQTLIDQNEE